MHRLCLIIVAHLSMLVMFVLTSDMLYNYVVLPFYNLDKFLSFVSNSFSFIALPKNKEE